MRLRLPLPAESAACIRTSQQSVAAFLSGSTSSMLVELCMVALALQQCSSVVSSCSNQTPCPLPNMSLALQESPAHIARVLKYMEELQSEYTVYIIDHVNR